MKKIINNLFILFFLNKEKRNFIKSNIYLCKSNIKNYKNRLDGGKYFDYYNSKNTDLHNLKFWERLLEKFNNLKYLYNRYNKENYDYKEECTKLLVLDSYIPIAMRMVNNYKIINLEENCSEESLMGNFSFIMRNQEVKMKSANIDSPSNLEDSTNLGKGAYIIQN